jgi:hypothetical protein
LIAQSLASGLQEALNGAVYDRRSSQLRVQNRANGGEGVSQSLLKDKAFSTFLDQNPPFELPPENGISPSTKACPAQWPVVDNSASSD